MSETRSTGERIQARLKSVARNEGWDVEATITRYVLERLLYRMQQAGHTHAFHLKGALSVMRWTGGTLHRPTQDMDLNGTNKSQNVQAQLKEITLAIRDACKLDIDDGIAFDLNTLGIKKQRQHEGNTEGGKIEMKAQVGSSQTTIRVDVGFGHPVTPDPEHVELTPVTDDMPAPQVALYPLETTISEKVSAALSYGRFNTRINDYYDLWYILTQSRHSFDGSVLTDALSRTLNHQGVQIPDGTPEGYTDACAQAKNKEWQKFLNKKSLDAPDIETVMPQLRSFVLPVLESVRDEKPAPGSWDPDAGWQDAPALEPT